MITLQDWITSSNNYPERANSPELTDKVKSNAQVLCDKANAFLTELGWKDPVKLTSGFRTLEVNENTPGAALHSGHESGEALDIWDNFNQTLCQLVESHPELLRKYSLFMEDKRSTKGKNENWCHIDFRWRPDRSSRTFIP